jgi:hypothetical protein
MAAAATRSASAWAATTASSARQAIRVRATEAVQGLPSRARVLPGPASARRARVLVTVAARTRASRWARPVATATAARRTTRAPRASPATPWR